MLQTYKATLNGNRLEWNGEVPDAVQDQKPVSVYITILETEETARQELRPFGLAAGEFDVPDDFNQPLPAEILAAFQGE